MFQRDVPHKPGMRTLRDQQILAPEPGHRRARMTTGSERKGQHRDNPSTRVRTVPGHREPSSQLG
jgi:hypothetical protein